MTMPEHETHPAVDPAAAASVEAAFLEVDAAAPEGWRVELVEGEIHVMPPANGSHEEFVIELSGQVRDHRRDLHGYTGIGLWLPGGPPGDRVIPDLVVAPRGSFHNNIQYQQHVAAVLLVGEVTSKSTGDNDRGPKLRAYARAGIPLYLLVDRDSGMVTLYSRPTRERYVQQVSAELSEPFELPEPLGFTLDTGQF